MPNTKKSLDEKAFNKLQKYSDEGRVAKLNEKAIESIGKQYEKAKHAEAVVLDKEQMEMQKKFQRLETAKLHAKEEEHERRSGGLDHHIGEVSKSVADLLVRDYVELPTVQRRIHGKIVALKDLDLPPILHTFLAMEGFVTHALEEHMNSLDESHLPELVRHGRHPTLNKHITMVHREIYKYIEQLGNAFAESELRDLEKLLEEALQEDTDLNDTLIYFYGDVFMDHPTIRKKKIALHLLLEMKMSERTEANFDPLDALNCKYLRLNHQTVDELTSLCRKRGKSPDVHPHTPSLSPEQITEYIFDSSRSKRRHTYDDRMSKPAAPPSQPRRHTTGPYTGRVEPVDMHQYKSSHPNHQVVKATCSPTNWRTSCPQKTESRKGSPHKANAADMTHDRHTQSPYKTAPGTRSPPHTNRQTSSPLKHGPRKASPPGTSQSRKNK